MITFYPGPSKVYESIPKLVKKAHKKGVLSINHRSPEFQDIYRKAVALVKDKLKIPGDYEAYFTSSATECWEIVAQSLIKDKSVHIYNGAFGEKWFKYTHRLKPGATSLAFDLDHAPETKTYTEDTLCVTHNETSNGTRLPLETISALREANPGALIAVDATSSLAGQPVNFADVDVVYASVQKCFGLPAGLALMICSPRAIKRAEEINDRAYYNSLLFIRENALNWQTHYTPNVLNIYLLMATMKKYVGIDKMEENIQIRYESWLAFISRYQQLEMLSGNTNLQSRTVVTVKAEPALINGIKEKAKSKGIILGNGYGQWKKGTFRIANFPAITDKEINLLKKFLDSFFAKHV